MAKFNEAAGDWEQPDEGEERLPAPEAAGDPWKDFFEGPIPGGSAAPAQPSAEDAWRILSTRPAASPPEQPRSLPAEAPAQPAANDDQWGEVVAASGYDEAAPPPIYTGKKEGEPRRRHADPFMDPSLLVDLPTRVSPGYDSREEPGPPEPYADDDGSASWDREDDVVLRAFEEHARAEPEPIRQATPFAVPPGRQDSFETLFGSDADALVEEVDEEPIEEVLPGSWKDTPAVEAGSQSWQGVVVSPSLSGITPRPRWEEVPEEDADPTEAEYEPAPLPWQSPKAFEYANAVNGENETPVRQSRRPRSLVREIVETGLLALLVFLAVRASFQNFKVDGNSMFPTLENGQFLIVNKLVYSEVDVERLSRFVPFLDPGDQPKRYVFHGPERGEIVVLQDPRNPQVDLIKRVIGLPGETIEIVNGHIFINGQQLEEPYIKSPWRYTGPAQTVPAGMYFVMGDNRDNSLDSRSPNIGFIPKEMIIGKTLMSYWPSGKIGLAANETPKLTGKTIAEFRAETANAQTPPDGKK